MLARAYATAPRASIYYGLGVTEHSQGWTTVRASATLAMLTGNIGVPGTGVNPLRGQNNVQGSCDMGSFPHELPGYRHVSDGSVRALFERYDNVPASLADACLLRLSELHEPCKVFTLDRDFQIYRRHGRRAAPDTSPCA